MAKESTIMMRKNEDGAWEETQASIKQRIQDCTGFDKFEIELMESDSFSGICRFVKFTYNDFGWSLDLEIPEYISRDTAFDLVR